MFFSRAPAGGQSLPINSIEHRRSAPAKLVLRERAGALRPRPSAHPWCAPWLVLFFVRVTSIEHRQSAPRQFGERFGIASHVHVVVFAVAVALGGLEGSLRRLFAEDRSDSGAGRQPTASAGTPKVINSGSTNTSIRRNTSTPTSTTNTTTPTPGH